MRFALKVGRLSLANHSIEFDMEFPEVSLQGAPKNLEALWPSARNARHLESFASGRHDLVARILIVMRCAVAMLPFVFDTDQIPRTLPDLCHLEVGNFPFALELHFIAFLQSDKAHHLRSDVRLKLAIAALNDKSVSKHSIHTPGDRRLSLGSRFILNVAITLKILDERRHYKNDNTQERSYQNRLGNYLARLIHRGLDFGLADVA
jgi:hypothetical protein